MKIEWLIASVTAVDPPVRTESEVFRAIVDIFSNLA